MTKNEFKEILKIYDNIIENAKNNIEKYLGELNVATLKKIELMTEQAKKNSAPDEPKGEAIDTMRRQLAYK